MCEYSQLRHTLYSSSTTGLPSHRIMAAQAKRQPLDRVGPKGLSVHDSQVLHAVLSNLEGKVDFAHAALDMAESNGKALSLDMAASNGKNM